MRNIVKRGIFELREVSCSNLGEVKKKKRFELGG